MPFGSVTLPMLLLLSERPALRSLPVSPERRGSVLPSTQVDENWATALLSVVLHSYGDRLSHMLPFF